MGRDSSKSGSISASSRSPVRRGSRSGSPRARAPRDNEENPCRIWVGGLNDRINEEDLKDVFLSYGGITEVRIRSTSRDTFAFVEFSEHAGAKKAIAEVDQTRVSGTLVKCNWASFKGGDSGSYKTGGRYQIWVGRLNDQTSERKIRDRMEEFGRVISMQLRSTSQDVFCFVEYEQRDACQKAIDAMHDKKFDGARIVVEWSRRNQDCDSGGRSRRSPSYRRRSRSRSRRRDRGRRSRSYEVHSSRSPRRDRRAPPQGKYKAEIENIPSEMTWQDLKSLARKMRGGEDVTFARTYREGDLCLGLLEFETKRSMEKLIDALNGKRINGRKVKLRAL